MKKNTENYYIDFYRFIFSFIILMYHSWIFTGEYGLGYFNSGYYGVDFYFIVTGYLMMNSIKKLGNINENITKMTFKYISNKFLKLLPALIITFFVGCILVYGKELFSIKLIFSNKIWGELLQLGIFGYELSINSSWWYISAMFVVLLILYPLALKFKNSYIYYIAPLLLLLSLMIINYYHININDPMPVTLFFRNGFYKGLIFIILGNISYVCTEKIKSLTISKIKKIVLTFIETTFYIILILNMHFAFLDSILIAILFLICISLTFSNQTLISKYFKSNLWKKIGSIGFYMYLCQISIRTFLLKYIEHNYHHILLNYAILTMIISLILYFIIEKLLKKKLLPLFKKMI